LPPVNVKNESVDDRLTIRGSITKVF